MIAAHATLVFAEADVQLPVEIVLDTPVSAYRFGKFADRKQSAEDVERVSMLARPWESSRSEIAIPTALRSRQSSSGSTDFGAATDRVGPCLVTTVARLNSHVLVNLLGVLLQRLVDRFFDLLIELG